MKIRDLRFPRDCAVKSGSLLLPPRRGWRPPAELLEARIVPAAIFWDGGGDGVSWTSANNWSNDAVPTAADDVTINPAGDVTVTLGDARAVNSLSMPGDDGLSITGSLTVAAASTVHDLVLSGNGALVANAPTSLTGSGTFSGEAVLGGSAVITNMGTLAISSGLPNVRTELRNVGTIEHSNAQLDFDAAGGRLRVLGGGVYHTINTDPNAGLRSFNGGLGITIESGGVFRVDSPNDVAFQTNNANAPAFNIAGGVLEVVNGSLAVNTNGAWTNARLDVAAGAAVNFVGGTITVNGTLGGSGAGTVNLTSNGTLAFPAEGATLNFPAGLFHWIGEGVIDGPGVATNTGVINISSGLPNLRTELRNAGMIEHGNAQLDFDAAGGKLRVLAGGVYHTVNTDLNAGLRSFGGGQGIVIEAGGVFRVDSPNDVAFQTNNANAPAFDVAGGVLAVLNGSLAVNTNGTWTNARLDVAAGAAVNFVGGTITVNGTLGGSGAGAVNLTSNGTLAFPAEGATLNFPAGLFHWIGEGVISGPGVATNTGVINISSGLPNLRTELRNAGMIEHGNAQLDFDAAGGRLRVLGGGVYHTINTDPNAGLRSFNGGLGITIESGGVFRVDSPNDVAFQTNNANAPAFNIAGGVLEVVNGSLAVNTNGAWTNARLDVAAGAAVNFVGGTITVNGTLGGSGAGTVNLTSNGTLAFPAEGATLNFPAGLFHWIGEGVIDGPGVATNTGVINISSGLPNLRTELRNAGMIEHGNAQLDFDAAGGKLRVLAGGVYHTVNTDLNAGLRSFGGGQGIVIEAGGVFRVDSPNDVAFQTNNANAPAFDIAGGVLDVLNGSLAVNTNGTWTNARLDVAAGAAVNFVGGTITVNGTLGGSGAGTVNLTSNGTLAFPAQGATLNFPAGLFHWIGEGVIDGPGVATNTGVINISSGLPNLRTELRNAGVIEHGTAQLDFEGAAGKVTVVAGGLYLTEPTTGGAGFRSFSGGQGAFIENGGVLRHDSPFQFATNNANSPTLSNAGTVEVVHGTLWVNGTLVQRSGSALTGGAWIVRDGATLNLNGAIASNAGAITIEGTGSLPGLGALAGNTGSLILRDGADLTTTANFTNTGLLRLGEGSVLTAPGFTQTSTGRVEFEIDGPTTADFGRIVSTGAATLAGTAGVVFNTDLALGAGQSLTLMSFASQTGDFSRFDGLNLQRTPLLEKVTTGTSLVLQSLKDAANLDVTVVNAPASGIAGQSFAFSYSVQNTSAFATLATSWTDTVYLSKDNTLSPDDIILTRVTHSGAVAAGASYTESVSVPLPGATIGDYRVLVFADSRGFVPDPDRANNVEASATPFALDVPELTPGATLTSTIATGQDRWFRVTLPQGTTPSFVLSGAVAGEAELYASFREVPTRADFDDSAFNRNSTLQRITGEVSAAGTYYVLVHGREAAGAGQSFTLTTSGLSFDLLGTEITRGVASGKVTTTLQGAQFTPGTTFKLQSAGRPDIVASEVYFRDANTMFATFDLTRQEPGGYNIVATNGTQTDTLPNSFSVIDAGSAKPGTLVYNLEAPRYIRPPFGDATLVTITYENIGGTDISAPLFTLLAENARLRFSDETTFLEPTYRSARDVLAVHELLGVSGSLAGVLQPGEKGRIEMVFQPIQDFAHAFSHFELIVGPNDATPFPIDRLKEDLQPAELADDAWNAVFANLKSAVGTTVGSYRSMLVDNANYLGQFGEVSPDTARLLQFELSQASDFGAIAQHYQEGAFGRGSGGLLNTRVVVASDNSSIELSDGVTAAFFIRQSDGIYATEGADGAVLTRAGSGAITILAADGSKTAFRASDGRVNFLEDTNGNRTTATWNTNGQLTALTNSFNGDATTYTYNAAGRVATRTDAVGRVTSYGYDAGGEHLTSVTTPQGKISYTYVTGQGAAREHALASVTGFDGVTTSFTYDTLGRLTREQIGTGANAIGVDYAYDSAGKVTTTDGAGRVTTTYRSILGQVARVVEPDGDVTSASYDVAGRLLSITDPAGITSKSIFGANGALEGSTGPDKTKTAVTFGDQRRVTSVTDPGNDTTRFGYDTRGNLISKILPDGATDRLEYDNAGRVIAATDANGERTTFSYNSVGLLETKTLAGGEAASFTYDAHRNLLTASDGDGATTFTYDAADRITSVTYPNGKSVAITYDAFGRQASVSDQSGYTVRYSYDTLGRLDEVRDTGGALLVSYDYDATGQLASETRANGSTTAYTYDSQGNVTTITHRDAANAITGFFNYTRDNLGRVASVTTEDGTTQYTYDLQGQLTRVVLPGGRTIEYRYDAEGNRTAVVDSQAGTASYAVNIGDQYTSAGGENFTYDAAGRLVSQSNGGATTAFTYDSAGRLTGAISSGVATEYIFDALGNRIAKTENGIRTDFAIDPTGLGTVIGEYRGATTLANYAQGLGLAARAAGGATSFYHFDAIGNTSLISGAGGAAVATYDYLPFGEIAAQTGTLAQPLTFGGRLGVQDDAGDAFYMRARTYDAGLGRFTTRDPADLRAGDTNLYRFVHNDPVNASDPTGLAPFGGTLPAGLPIPTRPGSLPIPSAPPPPPPPAPTSGLPIGANGRPYLPFPGQTPPVPGPAPVPTAPPPGPVVGPNGPYLPGPGTPPPAPGAPPPAPAPPTPAPGAPPTGPAGAGAAEAAGGISALEALGPGLILFGGAALLIDGGETLFNGVFPNAGKLPEQNVLDGTVDRLTSRSGASELFTDLVQVGREGGKSEQDATLDAITFLRSRGIYDPVFNPQPRPVEVIRPNDPNNIVGPAGARADEVPDVIAPGQVRFDGFVNTNEAFGYRIEFENQPSASAPAQVVKVTQTLDPDLDLSTFRFANFGWGSFKVEVPANADGSSFHALVDATATLGVNVQVDADLNTLTGLLQVTFTSLDPLTGEVPADPFAGFLPPDDASGRGDGFINYSVEAKAGLANGTAFTSLASIVFDTENPIATPTVTNTLDTIAPTSQVTAFASATSTRTNIPIRWTAADDAGGSGLSGTSIFFRDNNGPLQPLTVDDATNGVRFVGEVGHTYRFFSTAIDAVGNVEPIGATPDAEITVIAPALLTAPKNRITLTDGDGDRYTIRLTGPAGATLRYSQVDADGAGPRNAGPLDFLVVDGGSSRHTLSVTVQRAKDGPDADRRPDGDGVVTIGDVRINGSLQAFVATASNLNINGFSASGTVKSIAIRDLLRPDELLADPTIQIGGAVSGKTTLTARHVSSGASLSTPGTFAAITAASIGDARITATAIGKLTTTLGAMNADLNVMGAIGAVNIKTGVDAGDWRAASFGGISIKNGTFAADVVATGGVGKIAVKGGSLTGDLLARKFGAVAVTGGDFSGQLVSETPATVLGTAAALKSLSIVAGNLTGDIDLLGRLGKVTVKENARGVGGTLSGDLNAASFGKIALKGGDLSGSITSLTPAGTLGRTAALAGLSVSSGDLTGDVRVLGALGPITVLGGKNGVGGNVAGASIVAAKIAALTVAQNVVDSTILAGADLGADGAFSGDDTFAAGSIGPVVIGTSRTMGGISASIIGAGFSTADSVLKNADDAILGGRVSAIASITVAGQVDAASYLAAGRFSGKVKIAGASIDPASDALGRFFLG